MTSISIVIPVFRSRAWIGETLESIRSQTFPVDQLEIIIVDDGSSGDSVAIARTFMQRHKMRGTVLVVDRDLGFTAARNRGWQAAAGDWIQFLDSDDVLAPNKLEAQMREVSQLPDVIYTSWQHLGPTGNTWQQVGPVTNPQLVEPILLKLVSPHAGLLGPALVRRKSLEAVGGFSEGVVYPDGEHLMLKIAGMGGRFVEAPSPLPLFFIRQSDTKANAAHANLARQHLQNVVIAEAMLRQMKFGTLPRQDVKEIAGLCGWGLGVLYEHDWAAFQQYWQWLREIDPGFLPRHSMKLRLASAVLGYESAEGLALAYRWIKSSPRRLIALISKAASWSRAQAAGQLRKATSTVSDAPFASTKGGYGFVGAAAVLIAIGMTAVAGLAALDWLDSAPVHPARPTEASRADPRLVRADVRPSQTDSLKLVGKGPARLQSEMRTASAAAEPPIPAAAKSDLPKDVSRPLPPVEETASIAADEPPTTPAKLGPPELPTPVPATTIDLRGVAAPVRPAEARIAPAIPLEPLPASATAASAVVATPATRTGLSVVTASIAPAEPKMPPPAPIEPLPAAASAAPNAVAPPAPPVPAARTELGDAAAPTPRDEPKVASAIPSEPAAAGTLPTTVVAPLPATKPDHSIAPAPAAPIEPRTASPIPFQPLPATAGTAPTAFATPTAAMRTDPSRAAAPIVPGDPKIASATAAEPRRAPISSVAIEAPAPQPAAKPNESKVELGPKASVLSQEEQERAEKLVVRGERDLADGNVALARQFFLRAATAGLARGCVLLAATYDPRELARQGVLGVQPNLALARKWYERARELGARDAEERLARLSGG